MPATIVDELDAGWSYVGDPWAPASSSACYNGSINYQNADGDPSGKAKWNVTGLSAGSYDIAWSYAPSGSRCPDVPWIVYDSNGSTVLASGTFDQTQTTFDFNVVDDLSNSIGFKYVPGHPFTITGTSLTVEVNRGGTNGSGTVIADAVWVNAAAPPSSNRINRVICSGGE